ncbi:MAG: GFA family protein [Burkholderiales bacterium]|nr:GFA family protein [Burkholderiales bacterium]
MSTSNQSLRAQCKCGANLMTITGKPVMRAVCHCHFCQAYTGREKSDFVIYRRGQVQLPEANKARFRFFKKPAFVDRGACIECGGAAYEHVNIPLLPGLVFIPAPNHEQTGVLPDPALHMFYHRRKTDVADSVPKYTGPLNGEWQFVRRLIWALVSSRS